MIICYGFEAIDEENATWFEIYFYKKQVSQMSLAEVKKAIIHDIDERTDEKILNGYQWTILHGSDEGKQVKVWLSAEYQANFKAKHDAAVAYPDHVSWPMKYKVSEDEETGAPVYENFQSLQELVQFYLGGIAYIEQCYNEGWAEKDNIDFGPYEQALASDNS